MRLPCSSILKEAIENILVVTLCLMGCSLEVQAANAALVQPPAESAAGEGLWSHDNVFPWCATPPWDAKQRTPEERAQMLERLGIHHIGYNWREEAIADFDEQIEAFKRHHIEVLSWALYDADDPGVDANWESRMIASPNVLGGDGNVPKSGMTVHALLEMFKRHRIHPQLWLIQPFHQYRFPTPVEEMSPEALKRLSIRQMLEDFPKTPKDQAMRVAQEATRIAALERLAAPYGVKVEFFTHNFWFGMTDNQLAVIEKLKELRVTDVGIVYDFQHDRDAIHDDRGNFPLIWRRISPYVVAVGVTPAPSDNYSNDLYPSQDEHELEMMRTIEESGWRGPIGLDVRDLTKHTGGDAAIALKNSLDGLDWLAAELKHPGSGGPQPFPTVR